MSFYRQTARISHRVRICDACATFILAGETYLDIAGKTDCEFWTGAYHPDCRECEVRLNYEEHMCQDDWWTLQEFLEDDPTLLEGLPDAVRARFKGLE